MRKFPITGGPHTGKSTLIKALRESGLPIVPEAATLVIAEQREREKEEPGYVGKFPWNNYGVFGKLVIAKQLRQEAAVPKDTLVVILDRGLIDTVAYARLNKCDFLLPKIKPHIDVARYSGALICDFVGEYTQTEDRKETFEEAQATHELLVQAYEESGLTIVHLPTVSVEERVAIVQATLS